MEPGARPPPCPPAERSPAAGLRPPKAGEEPPRPVLGRGGGGSRGASGGARRGGGGGGGGAGGGVGGGGAGAHVSVDEGQARVGVGELLLEDLDLRGRVESVEAREGRRRARKGGDLARQEGRGSSVHVALRRKRSCRGLSACSA